MMQSTEATLATLLGEASSAHNDYEIAELGAQ